MIPLRTNLLAVYCVLLSLSSCSWRWKLGHFANLQPATRLGALNSISVHDSEPEEGAFSSLSGPAERRVHVCRKFPQNGPSQARDDPDAADGGDDAGGVRWR
eukprot:2715474-Rhodomonas_salina.1